MKKILAAVLALCLALPLTACAGSEAPSSSGSGESRAPAGVYPVRNVNGIVQWGAGGGTDSLMRPLAALAEKQLGKSIVIQNMAGAAGSVAAQYVYDADADGYNLLMGAENPALYDVLEISRLTYDNFDCVYLIGDEVVGIVVGKGSRYASFTEIVEAAKAAPGTVKLSTTGTGGLPWAVAAFIADVTGAAFNQIPYDSDASAKTAVMNGECDFTVCKVQSGIEDYRAGDVRFLCLLAEEPVEIMPQVPLITAEYPGFAKYLPWGPFYGVFVREGTGASVIETLSGAFQAAGADAGYQELLANLNVNFLGYTGSEASDYIAAWRENTINALKNSGALN